MKKSKLTQVKRALTLAAECCNELKESILGEIADESKGRQAEQILMRLRAFVNAARDEMKNWKVGYPKGKHRIKPDQLEAIRQWMGAPPPKPKVRMLARKLGLSHTTVYAVLKELGWKKRQS